MPSPKLIIHIGRHKTGTSSIQYFLTQNRVALKGRGILYPYPIGDRYAHHGIVRHLENRPRDTDPTLDSIRTLAGKWARESPLTVLSSEAFQRLEPQAVAAFFDSVGISPLQTTIVVYLRDQLSYAWSSYVQHLIEQVKSPYLDSYLRSFNPDYFKFLSQWSSCYPKENIVVRVADRRLLRDGDIVSDFLSLFHLLRSDFPATSIDRNISGGWRIAAAKRRLNAVLEGEVPEDLLRKKLSGPLQDLAQRFPELRQKPRLPSDTVTEFQHRFKESNIRAFREFVGGQCPFRYEWEGEAAVDYDEGLNEEHIAALTQFKRRQIPDKWLEILRNIPK